jgi:hypothetical protein
MNDTYQWFLKLPPNCKEHFLDFIFIRDLSPKSAKDEYFEFLDECESPIEIMLGMSIEIYLELHSLRFAITSQEEVKINGHKYRPDFRISYIDKLQKERFLYVDCDGHDFHERTKQQVAYQNNRDFDMKFENIELLHFSGFQIHNDDIQCAKKVYEYIINRIDSGE